MTYLNPHLLPAQDTAEYDFIPEQDKLENQDPDVLWTTDEMTGERVRTERRRRQPDLTQSEMDAERKPDAHQAVGQPAFAQPEVRDKPKSGPGSRGPYKKKRDLP